MLSCTTQGPLGWKPDPGLHVKVVRTTTDTFTGENLAGVSGCICLSTDRPTMWARENPESFCVVYLLEFFM